MKDQKRFAALALSAVMVFSMAGSVSAAQKVESKDDLDRSNNRCSAWYNR